MKRAIILPIIFSVILIGITANYAFAADTEVQAISVIDSDGEFHAWQITGADVTSSLEVSLCDPNFTNDPFLVVQSPTMNKFNDDAFACGFVLESMVIFSPGEVENGCWITQSKSFANQAFGEYELELDLMGPGQITPLGTVDSITADCPVDIPVGGTYIPIDTASLLLAGASSVSMWMIPVVLAGAGIGVFVIKRRN